MAKSKQKIQARECRKNGESIKTIAKKLNVSSSTVSLWCRDIELTTEQIAKLEKQSKDPYYGRRSQYLSELKKKTANTVKEIQETAKIEIGTLTPKEYLVSGIALYWAEGFKKDNMVGFANSDPNMVIFILNWFEKCLLVKKTDIRLRVGINEYQKRRTSEIEEFWSKKTSIPLSQFNKPFFQKVQWKKIYENENEYVGTLRIRVLKSTNLLRKIHGYINALK